MKRFLLFAIALVLTANLVSQNKDLSDYSYVIVPEQYDFLNKKDQYQLNSMTKFFFEKNGFNAYMAVDAPEANKCEGLYANVEKLKTVFGTKLQVVLKDCNDAEIYRSQEGKSKYKEYDKTYQDALRKAFNSFELLNVNQKDVTLLASQPTATLNTKEATKQLVEEELAMPKVSKVQGNLLPDAKFSNYSNSGNSYLLRKTTEGYSLYQEVVDQADGLLLKGKIIVMDKVVKFMDTSGKVSDASFDPSGNLVIKGDSSQSIYLSED